MKSIIRYLSLSVLIVFSHFISHPLCAQNFEETINIADNQFKYGEFSLALKTYQRALFFSDGRRDLYLFRQIAGISYIKNDYETAWKYYGLAYNQTENDTLKTELLFKKASCQMLNRNFQLALIDLFSVNDSSEITQKRLDFYLATCYFGLEDFNTSLTYFESCVELGDRKELSSLFSGNNLYSPSPKKARIMSMILPGLGQAYSGDLKSGLNSMVLTSGLIALTIHIGNTYSPIDAILAVIPWFQRYYTGGYGKAGEIAVNKRQLKRNEAYTKILNMISVNEAAL